MQILDRIKQIIQKYPKHYTKILKRPENSELLFFINQKTPLLTNPIYNISTKLNWIFNNRIDFPLCLTCGKKIGELENIKLHKQYKQHCSIQCAALDKDVRQKIKQTCLEKYGVDHPWKNQTIKNKIYNTNLERYGDIIASKSQIIKERAQKTCLEKYGCKVSSQNESVKEKSRQTCLEKYGVEYVTQTKQMQEKSRQTCLEKYGVDNPFKAIICKDKIKQTCLEKYGEENFAKTNLYKIKSKLTNLEKYKYDNICKTPEYRKKYYQRLFNNPYIIPNFTFETYFNTDRFHNDQLQWKCLQCGNILKGHMSTSPYVINNINVPIVCRKCHPYISGFSNMQKQLAQFCKQHFPELQQNNRQLIKPYQLDIVIPQIKLAVEFNGIYWHSLQAGTQTRYHLNKVLACNQRGYRLVHIWQDQWQNNRDQIKQKLVRIFQNRQNLYFRDQILVLDRSWHNNIQINGYQLISQKQPQIIYRMGNSVQNCGYLIYQKVHK